MFPFEFEDIKLKEIKDIIYGFNDSKSTCDVIPLRIFKLCPDSILVHLTNLLNKSVNEGNMPTALKRSKIVPVHKSGSRLNMNNYRPISLLSYSNI